MCFSSIIFCWKYALIRSGIIKPFGGEDFKPNQYKGNIHKLIDNKVKNVKKGVYILTRDLTGDENIVIEGILKLQPQRGILIPNAAYLKWYVIYPQFKQQESTQCPGDTSFNSIGSVESMHS